MDRRAFERQTRVKCRRLQALDDIAERAWGPPNARAEAAQSEREERFRQSANASRQGYDDSLCLAVLMFPDAT
jgi:hypothetical protein